VDELVEWFNLAAVHRAPARFDVEKLQWINQQHLKRADDARLAQLTRPLLEADGYSVEGGPDLASVIALVKERISTIKELAKAMIYFYRRVEPIQALRDQHYKPESASAIAALRFSLEQLGTDEWNRQTIGEAIKKAASDDKLKLPQVAMPVRVMVSGGTQTPSIDAVIEVIGRDQVLQRIDRELERYPRG
jgi:glutamyl-tRNA synthetase